MGVVSGALWWVSIPWAVDPSPLPQEPPIDPNRVTPGLLAMASFAFLIVAVALLYLSMRKQMRKVDPNLPNGPGDDERAEDERLTEEAVERGEESAGEKGAPGEKGS